MSGALLQNSLTVAGATALVATLLGFVSALALLILPAKGRVALTAAAVVCLALPPFLLTNSWLHYLGLAGSWRQWWPFDIYSIYGTVWVLALWLWPVPMLLIFSAWQRLQRAHLESDPAVAGWALIRWILWPTARTGVLLGLILVFVLALNHFAVPAILQVKVFPAEMWLRLTTTLDYSAAVRLALPLILAPLLLVLWLSRRPATWPVLEEEAPAHLVRRQLGPMWQWFALGGTLVLMVLAIGLPLLDLFSLQRTWTELAPALAASRRALVQSFAFSAGAAVLAVGAGLVLWQWRIGWLVWTVFLTPGVLLGLALIVIFNRPWTEAIYQSTAIIYLGLAVRYLAVGWTGANRAMRALDPQLRDWARLNGASRWQMLRFVEGPQVYRPLAAVAYIVYLLCLWDAETLLMIVPPGGETLALRIFNLLHYGHNPQVNALCLTLLVLALLPLGIVGLACGLRSLARIRTAAKQRFALLAVGAMAAGLLTGCASESERDGAVALESRFFRAVEVTGSWGLALGQFNKPRSVAVDLEDCFYAVDMTGRVQKFSAEGQFLLVWQMEEIDKGRPKGMGRDADGNIIVVEPHYSRINHFTPTGQLVRQWGVHGPNPGQLMFPRSVAVEDESGEIFVSEYGAVERVQKFDEKGEEWLATWGTAGADPGEFNRAEGLDVDAEGKLFVADSCNHRIQVFSPEGRFLRAYGRAGTGLGEFSYPYDVRVDAEGNQFVCEFGNSRIQIFDAQDRPVESVGGIGRKAGQFSNPWSIALDSVGNLYVADGGNHRIQKFIRRNPVRQAEPRAERPGARERNSTL